MTSGKGSTKGSEKGRKRVIVAASPPDQPFQVATSTDAVPLEQPGVPEVTHEQSQSMLR